VLQFYMLQQSMRDAVKRERYDEASRLKKKLDLLRARLMRKLEGKVMEQVDAMRATHERSMRTSALARARHDLAAALAVEDYESASRAQLIIEQEEARARRGSLLPRAIGRRLDLAWLRVNIASRVSTLRLFQAHEQRKDPQEHLESELKQAVEEESFERAAELALKLREMEEENARRDLVKMKDQLATQLRLTKLEVEKMGQDSDRRLIYEFEKARDAEDFETAGKLQRDINRREIYRLFAKLDDEIRRHREESMSKSAGVTDRAQLSEEAGTEDERDKKTSSKKYLYGGLFGNLDTYDDLVELMEAAVREEEYERAQLLRHRILEMDVVARFGEQLLAAEKAHDFETAGESA